MERRGWAGGACAGVEDVEYDGAADSGVVDGVLCGGGVGGAVGDGVCAGVMVAAEWGAGVLECRCAGEGVGCGGGAERSAWEWG